MVFFALAVVALMGIAALVVDVGYWYLRASQVQRTADAAALAGVVYMPGNFAKAEQIADNIAISNGFTDLHQVNVSRTSNPHQLSVSITDPSVPTFFAKIFGMNSITETRSSIAEYQPPVPLGSAENSIGTGDLSLGAGTPTNIWAAVNGYCTSKENGDEFLSGFDATYDQSTGHYECSADHPPGPNGGPSPTPTAAANYEYSPSGYFYDIVTAQQTGTLSAPLTVDAYDPGYQATGSCATGGETPDNSIGQAGTSVTTDFALTYAPVPPDHSQDVPVANVTVGPTSGPTAATGPYVAASGDPATCGQWVTLFTIPAGSSDGTYRLEVSTQADEPNSTGTNAYGLRVYQGSFTRCSTITNPGWSNPDPGDCTVIQGESSLSVYANNTANTGQGDFYLAQIDQSYANHTLTVNLFDPGEGSADIELINPDGQAVPFFWYTTDDVSTSPPCPDCAPDLGFQHYPASQPGTGTTELDVSGSLNPVPVGEASNSQFNDRHVQLTFYIPPTYDPTPDNGGWWKIRYIAQSGRGISDRTTWSVSLSGSPIHLVPQS